MSVGLIHILKIKFYNLRKDIFRIVQQMTYEYYTLYLQTIFTNYIYNLYMLFSVRYIYLLCL